MDAHLKVLPWMCECAIEELCVCFIAMLVGRELVHQDLRGLQLRALEEECKKAACIALDNYNQSLVQYIRVHNAHTHRHTDARTTCTSCGCSKRNPLGF